MNSSLTEIAAPAARPPMWVAIAWRLLAAAIPVALLLTNVRLLGVDALLVAEYQRAGFPADPYGFTTAERIHWAKIARDFLLNDEGIDFLGDLRFEDGSPVYNDRELRHMVDVKALVQVVLRVWFASLGVAAVTGAGLWFGGRRDELRSGLRLGGRLTLLLMGVLVVGLLVAFSVVFVGFHRIFFEGNSWLFLYTDTLIRLFPEQFWRDAFLFVGLTTLAEAAIVLLLTRRRS